MEAVPGARLAVGANLFVARHFVLGVSGDYHAIGQYSHPDPLTDSAGGLGMSFSFGFAWGGR
jgi:hypothetical protein